MSSYHDQHSLSEHGFSSGVNQSIDSTSTVSENLDEIEEERGEEDTLDNSQNKSSTKLSVSHIRRQLHQGVFSIEKRHGSRFKSLCWQKIGDVVTDKGQKLPYVACMKCKTTFSRPNAVIGTTTLNRHLEICAAKKIVSSGTLDNIIKRTSTKEPSTTAKKQMADACVSMCVKDLRSFETVLGTGFQHVIETAINIGVQCGNVSVSQLLPHPTTVSRKITEKAKELKGTLAKTLKSELLEVGGGITTDMWTADYTKMKFISLTLHYITCDFELKERLLSVAHFEADSATGRAIREKLDEILNDFDIFDVVEKFNFVTDAGANMLCSMEIQPKNSHIICTCHRLNTVLEHVFEKWVDIPVPVASLMKYCKDLVRCFKQSGLMSKLPISLKQEVDCRWLSRLEMLKSVQTQYDEVQKVMVNERITEIYRITCINRKLLKELVDFLGCFNTVILELESSSSPTINKVAPCWYKLEQTCHDLQSDSEELAAIKLQTKTKMVEKEEITLLHLVGMFLWPKFRSSVQKFSSYYQPSDIHEKITEIMEMLGNTEINQITNSSLVPTVSGKSFLDDLEVDTITPSTSPQYEIEQYINMTSTPEKANMNILQFWKFHQELFPKLSQVARHVLATPASSAASERSFSVAGYTLQERRTRLKADIVDGLMFLKSNLP